MARRSVAILLVMTARIVLAMLVLFLATKNEGVHLVAFLFLALGTTRSSTFPFFLVTSTKLTVPKATVIVDDIHESPNSILSIDVRNPLQRNDSLVVPVGSRQELGGLLQPEQDDSG